MTLAPALAGVAAALFATRLILLATLHLVPNPYHPVRDAVSDYAVGPTRRLSTVMTGLTVAAWFVTAGAVWLGLSRWEDRALAASTIAAAGLCCLAIIAAPTDVAGRRTVRGRVHLLLAVGWFALSFVPMSNMADLAEARHWAAAGALTVLYWITLVGLVGLCLAMLRPIRGVFGLLQRVFLVGSALFYLVFTISLALA